MCNSAVYKRIDDMSGNGFRCRYTAEVAYDMLYEDSDASDQEEETQKDVSTVPTSVDEPPCNQLLVVIFLPTMTLIHQAMPFNYSCTQVLVV